MTPSFQTSFAVTNVLLIFSGLLLLVIGLVVSAVRLWRNQSSAPRAGILSVLLVLIASILLSVGVFRITFAEADSSASSAPNSAAIASAASQTSPRVSATTPAAPTTAQSQNVGRFPLRVAILIGLLLAVFGSYLFTREQKRDDFNPSSSAGLLYAGAGVFALVMALVVPTLPSQFTTAKASSLAPTSTDRPLPTRAVAQSATPSDTPVPSNTPTEPPTLTPAPNTEVAVLATSITYEHSELENPTGCSVTAQTMIFMRGDPSVKQAAIGKIFAGSLLQVSGQSADKLWLKVISHDGMNNVNVEGWVSTDFITKGMTCDESSIPVLTASATPTRTLIPSRTPYPSRTPRPTSTQAVKP